MSESVYQRDIVIPAENNFQFKDENLVTPPSVNDDKSDKTQSAKDKEKKDSEKDSKRELDKTQEVEQKNTGSTSSQKSLLLVDKTQHTMSGKSTIKSNVDVKETQNDAINVSFDREGAETVKSMSRITDGVGEARVRDKENGNEH
ncbi:unnamed protein product [Bursaphelenchus xylophilus]|uniref:(pine wood nematode) hypothetical protein n=1 Tax=Bursaphelenchus xylophilus TaxID=6326 RepID=A0A1I7RT37_BURXY|nr:unnamed protein product [Bursaphelenchus xylophilus]CAG9122637.1 unnamed protein product [Bursaphelenchus xylophilus]